MARLVFLGSPDAAVPSLRSLVDAGHEILVVVSQPDKRRGRGARSTPSPVKHAALDAGLVVTDRLDDVPASGAELGVVVAFGRIIPKPVLEAVPMINAHFSLLPRWRGAAPVERAILAGDNVTGVCVMRLEEGLDTGAVLATRSVRIDNKGREHAAELTRRLAELASVMLVEVLGQPVALIPPGMAQEGEATYAQKLAPEELRIDFTRSVAELERLVRLDRAWTTFRGERLLVLDAVGVPWAGAGASGSDLAGTEEEAEREEDRDVAPGTLRGADVRAGDGMLRLLRVQPAGRRPVPADDWIRGARAGGDEILGA